MQLESRFEQIFDSLCSGDFGSALTLVCPLIDGAGKKLYGMKRTGDRFRKVISDNNDFLYWMMSGGMLKLDQGADLLFSRPDKPNINLAQSLYKLVRNSLLHEGELSDEIEFVDQNRFGPAGRKIVLPKNLIWALAFMVVYLPCYRDNCPRTYSLRISGVQMPLQECWGDRSKIEDFFSNQIFKR